MVSRTELETNIRSMVAFDVLSKPLSSLGQKASRRLDKTAKETAEFIGNGEEFERVVAYVEQRDELKARTLREGIESFKEEHPRYGAVLEGMIQEKRLQNNRYLNYGLANGFKLGAEDYRRVMKDLGMTTREADAMYTHLLDISERLGKAKEDSLRSILL